MKRNGADILSDIDHRAAKTRAHIQQLSRDLSASTKAIEDFRDEENTLYSALARVRLDIIDKDNPAQSSIKDALRGAHDILKQRQEARDALDNQLRTNQAAQETIEAQRAAALKAYTSFLKKVQAQEDKALARLENTPDYAAREDTIDGLEMQVTRIAHKIAAANDDYAQKIVPYKNDPLFMYLWGREYGTGAYKAGGLTRMLDGWVARIVDYEPARVNYAMLSGIPEKLGAHEQSLEAQIDEVEAAQNAARQNALAAAGVQKSHSAAAKKQTAIAEMDARLHALEGEHQRILDKKAAFAENNDPLYLRAASVLSDMYKADSLENLRRAALLTATPEDDALVRRFFEIDTHIDEHKQRVETYTQALKTARHELSEIQNARTTFKAKGYDSPRTKFKDGNMFSILLGQFVTGILTNAHFWHAVAQLCVQIFDASNGNRRGYGIRPMGRGRTRSHSWGGAGRSSPRSSSRRSSGGFRTGGGF